MGGKKRGGGPKKRHMRKMKQKKHRTKKLKDSQRAQGGESFLKKNPIKGESEGRGKFGTSVSDNVMKEKDQNKKGRRRGESLAVAMGKLTFKRPV